MTLTILILLLILALGLILVEIFLVPGIGIPGIAGAALMIVALVLSFQISASIGYATASITALMSIGLILLALRSKTWDRLSQKEEITAKVISHIEDVKVGDRGKAISRLSPMGKAMFGDHFLEVSSKGEYIAEHTEVEIINIEGNKIIVIPT